jgi:hypothetical protein
MSAPGFTPISLYYSTTASAAPSAGNLANGELALNITDGRLFYKDNGGVVQVLATKAGASGDVVGPASATDNALVRFDTTTGKLVQNSVGVLSDAGVLTGLTGLTSSGSITFSSLTSGRVPYATTAGLLTDSANLLFDGTTLTANALTVTNAVTLSGGVANGVAYLNGSKVLTTGSALTFNGTSFGVPNIDLNNGGVQYFYSSGFGSYFALTNNANALTFGYNGSEQMRLTSTGLGIGTSSPDQKLVVQGSNVSLKIADGTYSSFVATISSANAYGNGSTVGQLYLRGQAGIGFTGNSGGATQMSLDSSGNLGLGVTPSAGQVTADKVFELGAAGCGLNANTSRVVALTANSWEKAGVGWVYGATAAASMYQQQGGASYWFTAPSGTAGNAISFTQAMTLAANGEWNIDSGTSGGRITLTPGGSGNTISSTTTGFGAFNILTLNGSQTVFQTSGSERARIDSSGNLLVGTTSASARVTIRNATSSDGLRLNQEGGTSLYVNNTNASYYAYFVYNGTNTGRIETSGTTTSYVTSSDYRLKNTIAPMTGALAKVALLKPCTYKWNADDSDGQGFIAHELAEVVPGCVTGEKDAVDADGKPVYQGIDTSFLVATLTAAIQEQQALITELKARLDAANL